jgi:hypothetical protein
MVGYVHVRLFVPTTCADILVLFSLCCSFDMAAFAKKGSALVKEKREQAERPCAKATAKLAASGGTVRLSATSGVKDEEAEAEGASSFLCVLFGFELDAHESVHGTAVHLQQQLRQEQRTVQKKIIKGIPSLRAI